ncbi:helix-turn-helix domain-containing protein [Pandoraea apista]|jgi:transcriptional regulator with XRE-family HTH domain|uniref:helix-turn-helix domain-containing protein n=1 Tax=Pandoraea apista TaxID=93218 RepID=UPI000B8C6C20|nr:helix-turn-helix transcriptional regulator [Pandoraea apista]OXS89468.1 hypothetical protein B7H01_19370 [Pandoraea apista]
MPAKPLTPEQKADAARLMGLFENQKAIENKQGKRLTQAILADDLGYATQSAVSQYLKGKVPLNVEASVKFAARFGCRVSAFSPSIQEEIDRIASFATGAGKDMPMKKDPSPFADPGKAISKEASFQPVDIEGIAPKRPSQREIDVGSLYSQAPQQTQAAIDVLLLPPTDRAALAEASEEGIDASSGMGLLERKAGAALSALHERKKSNTGTGQS